MILQRLEQQWQKTAHHSVLSLVGSILLREVLSMARYFLLTSKGNFVIAMTKEKCVLLIVLSSGWKMWRQESNVWIPPKKVLNKHYKHTKLKVLYHLIPLFISFSIITYMHVPSLFHQFVICCRIIIKSCSCIWIFTHICFFMKSRNRCGIYKPS